jgi:hypothetical protein
MSEMGGIEVILKTLWRVGSDRLKSDVDACGGSQGPIEVGGIDYVLDMGRLEVAVKALWDPTTMSQICGWV